MTEKELLTKAAVYIQKYGWLKEDFGKADGPVCMLGALRCAAGFDPKEPVIDADYADEDPWCPIGPPSNMDVYLDTVNRIETALGMPIVEYNDRTRTTAEDVIYLLQKMAKEVPEE